MVLPDNIRNFLAQAVLHPKLSPLLCVGNKDKRTHGGRQLVVRVLCPKLVFDKIVRFGYFANVVVKRPNLTNKAMRPTKRRVVPNAKPNNEPIFDMFFILKFKDEICGDELIA